MSLSRLLSETNLLRVWNLELGPLAFGGTRFAGLQQAVNLPAGFPPTRCCFSWHELQSSMHISHLPSRRFHSKRRAHTLSQTQPVARHNRTNERTNPSLLLGWGRRPADRPGLAMTRRLPLHQTSGRRHCTIAEHCRAGGSVMAQAAAEAYSYRFAAIATPPLAARRIICLHDELPSCHGIRYPRGTV